MPSKLQGNGTIWEMSHVELRVIEVGNARSRHLFQRAPFKQLSRYYKISSKIHENFLLIDSLIPCL